MLPQASYTLMYIIVQITKIYYKIQKCCAKTILVKLVWIFKMFSSQYCGHMLIDKTILVDCCFKMSLFIWFVLCMLKERIIVVIQFVSGFQIWNHKYRFGDEILIAIYYIVEFTLMVFVNLKFIHDVHFVSFVHFM